MRKFLSFKLLGVIIVVILLAGCNDSLGVNFNETFENDYFSLKYDSTKFRLATDEEVKEHGFSFYMLDHNHTTEMSVFIFEREALQDFGGSTEEIANEILSSLVKAVSVEPVTFDDHNGYIYSDQHGMLLLVELDDNTLLIGLMSSKENADTAVISSAMESMKSIKIK